MMQRLPKRKIATVETVRRLKGHSGCEVLLCLVGDDYFVRKISASREYNPRLEQQADKQRALAACIRTPRVLDQGATGGLVHFDMEFIKGHDIKTFAPLQNVSTLSDFAERVVAPLGALARTGHGEVDARLFAAKVTSVGQAIERSAFFDAYEPLLRPILDRMEGADWSGVPQTNCHGDFTLENVLVREDGEIVLIDLLDGDLNSVWLDAAKLLQDLDSGWSLRSFLWKPALSSSDRLMAMLGRYLYEEATALLKLLLPTFEGRVHQLRALQAARVLPYARDEETFRHVVSGMHRLIANWT